MTFLSLHISIMVCLTMLRKSPFPPLLPLFRSLSTPCVLARPPRQLHLTNGGAPTLGGRFWMGGFRGYGASLWTAATLCAVGVAGLIQYINMKERRLLRAEIRKAAARELLSAEAYLKSIFEDPVALKDFQKKVDLVRGSWAQLKPLKVETTAHTMYKYLKSWDQSAAEIFDEQLDWMQQERIFNVMLSTLLGHLDDPKWLLENLIRLGHKHHALGVKPSHFLTMQTAILKSLEEHLGPAWTEEYYDAWSDVFSFISRMMIKTAYGHQDNGNSRDTHKTAATGNKQATGKPAGNNKPVPSKVRARLDERSTAAVMPRDPSGAAPSTSPPEPRTKTSPLQNESDHDDDVAGDDGHSPEA